MKTRRHRTPLSIWIIASLWAALILVSLFKAVQTRPAVIDGRWIGMIAISFGFAAYHMVALVRLSWWPIIVQAAAAGSGSLSHQMAGWWAQQAWMTLFFMLLPMAFYLACTLPHWRKLNWNPFGRPYRQPEDQAKFAF
jgi:hypothetical protein